jgi:sugar phosphate isomerase/epimerase
MAHINGLRIGVVHPQLYPQTISGEGPVVETVAALVAETAVSIVELSHVRDELTRARLKVLLASGGVRVIFNAQPAIIRNNWDLNAEDAAARAEAVAGLRQQMEEAHFLGAKLFCVMSGPDVAPEKRAAARGWLVESLGKLGDEAGRLGLSISLEACDREVDQKRLIGPIAEACEVVKLVKRDNVGLTLDLAHLLLLKENVVDAVYAARNYILHAQVSNCVLADGHPARGDQHPAFGTEGSLAGVEQVAGFLKALDKYGFWKRPNGGWLTIEVRPREEEYSSVVLAGALRLVLEAQASL